MDMGSGAGGYCIVVNKKFFEVSKATSSDEADWINWRDILSGVLQGSVLGQLLFVVNLNDLPDGLESIFKMYADDSKVVAGFGNAPWSGNELRSFFYDKNWIPKISFLRLSLKSGSGASIYGIYKIRKHFYSILIINTLGD